ncbi:hypothetical protein HZC21_04050 [Candidatus Peregrinibacteria bacterium]|nr:hypothetical protein [Candidatus Peregrinibacteria bacterium]
MYVFSGQDLMRHPTAWHWAMPLWLREMISSVVSLNTYLKFQGAVEIIFALVLLAWFLKPVIVRIVAALSTLELIGILILAFAPWNETNFLITFRDIGLVGASLALWIMLTKEKSLSHGTTGE